MTATLHGIGQPVLSGFGDRVRVGGGLRPFSFQGETLSPQVPI